MCVGLVKRLPTCNLCVYSVHKQKSKNGKKSCDFRGVLCSGTFDEAGEVTVCSMTESYCHTQDVKPLQRPTVE